MSCSVYFFTGTCLHHNITAQAFARQTALLADRAQGLQRDEHGSCVPVIDARCSNAVKVKVYPAMNFRYCHLVTAVKQQDMKSA